ncbi:MAG: hypothetical protein D6763_08270 [Alphaproteobacteria bacterium]|nr:MAG: hypothetical protein D6763_08270 [Alphaproteobacteria bacterium]
MRSPVLFLFLAVLTVAASGAYFLSKGLTGSQDIYYTHFLGYQWFEPERAARALATVKATAETNAAPEQDEEGNRRRLAAHNYPVLALTSRLATHLFPADLTPQIIFAQAAAFALGLAIAAAGLACAINMTPAFALAMGAMAILGFLPGPSPTDHLLIYGPVKNAINLIVLAISPGEAFSPLSFWPKSSLALILMAALANRWRGRIHTGYLLLLATMAFHITLGGIVFAGFVLLDLALRPKRLSVWRIGLLATGAAMLFTSGQWRILSEDSQGGAIEITIAIAISAFALSLIANRILVSRLSADVPVAASDTAAFVIAAIVFTPLAMSLYVASTQSATWGGMAIFLQLAARLIVLATSVLWLFACTRGVSWLAERNAEGAALAGVTFMCAVTVYGAAGSWWWEARFIDARLHDPAARAATEPLAPVYYRALQELMKVESPQR